MADDFNGDNAALCECIDAMTELNAKEALAPRVPASAVRLLSAAAARLRAKPTGTEGGEVRLDYPRSADRTHVPELEGMAVNQKPKTNDHREPRLFRYENSDLYQWWSKVGASVFDDPFGEPFVIAALAEGVGQ